MDTRTSPFQLRIERVRDALKQHGLAAVLVPSSDPHLSEYLPERWQGRQWLSGFTGSMARAGEAAGSDVDVLLIGSLGFGDAVKLLYPAQATLSREINPKVFSTDEWRAQLKAKNPFIRQVLIQPKIFLIGSDDELEKLGRRQPR